MNAELRPGADASRADAELAAARTLLIQAQQAVEIARVNVSQFVGLPPAQIAVAAPKLLQLPPERDRAAVGSGRKSRGGGAERRGRAD